MSSLIQSLSGGIFHQTVIQTFQAGAFNLSVANSKAPPTQNRIHSVIAEDVMKLFSDLKATRWLDHVQPFFGVVAASLDPSGYPPAVQGLLSDDPGFFASPDAELIRGLKTFLGDCLVQAIGAIDSDEKDYILRLRQDRQDAWTWNLYADKLSSRSEERSELIRIEEEIQNVAAEEREILKDRKAKLETWLEENLYCRLGLEGQKELFPIERGHVREMTLGEKNQDILTRLLFCEEARLFEELTLDQICDEDAPQYTSHPMISMIGSLGLCFHTNQEIKMTRERLPKMLVDDFEKTRLTSLYLPYMSIRNQGLVFLASLPHLQGLRQLGLAGNRIGPRGISALVNSPHIRSLEYLDLELNEFGDAGTAMLAEAKNMKSLRELYLHACFVGDGGAWALANSENFPSLTSLDLEGNRISQSTVASLRESRLFRNLKQLTISRERE